MPDIAYTVVSPSYHRPTTCQTHRYLPDVHYVVAESEAAAYRATHPHVIAMPDPVQGNIARVRNWILDHIQTPGIVMLDDDLTGMFRWNDCARHKLTPRSLHDFLAAGFLLCSELATVYWGVNIGHDKRVYRENVPISLTNFIGGPFCCHLENPLRYDERLPLKEDYDMTLQVLNRYRLTLRYNAVHYVARQAGKGDSTTGGCSAMRTVEREMDQLRLFQRKWGSGIVHFDSGNSHKANRRAGAAKTFDINPIIKPPIPGV